MHGIQVTQQLKSIGNFWHLQEKYVAQHRPDCPRRVLITLTCSVIYQIYVVSLIHLDFLGFLMLACVVLNSSNPTNGKITCVRPLILSYRVMSLHETADGEQQRRSVPTHSVNLDETAAQLLIIN